MSTQVGTSSLPRKEARQCAAPLIIPAVSSSQPPWSPFPLLPVFAQFAPLALNVPVSNALASWLAAGPRALVVRTN